MHPKQWDDARITELRALYDYGLDRFDIAKRLDKTPAAISGQIAKLGLATAGEGKRWTPERIASLTEFWTQGLSCSQIAARLGGVTRNAVIGKVHRLVLPSRVTVDKSESKRAIRARTAARKAKALADRQTQRNSEAIVAKAKSLQRSAQFLADGFVPGPELVIPLAERKTLMTLGDHDCHWPIGHPKSEEFHYCGKPEGAPNLGYCPHHYVRMHEPARPRRVCPPTQTLAYRKTYNFAQEAIVFGEQDLISTPPHKPPLALETV